MATEEVKEIENVENPETNYIETIKSLKENTVSKKDYDKLMKDNEQLLNALTNGEVVKVEATDAEDKAEKALEIIANSTGHRDLEYFQALLDYREETLQKEGIDVFVSDTVKDPSNFVECIEHCIDYSQGDPDLFDAELKRITVFPIQPKKRY